jgi:hypothetical protein
MSRTALPQSLKGALTEAMSLAFPITKPEDVEKRKKIVSGLTGPQISDLNKYGTTLLKRKSENELELLEIEAQLSQLQRICPHQGENALFDTCSYCGLSCSDQD